MPGPQFLSVEQVLLTTLVVKLAVMAALATMLVRYRRFRHILIFERRAWPDRLIFVAQPSASRSPPASPRGCCCNYNAADLTLEGAFLAGPDRRPVRRRARSAPWSASRRSSPARSIALPFAVGCGFAGGGLRELCPKEAIWHFSPFVFTSLPRRVWKMIRTLQVDWQVVLLLAPIAPRAAAPGARRAVERASPPVLLSPRRLGRGLMVVVLLATVLVRRDADQDLEQRPHRAPAAGTGEAAAGREDRGARQPDQPALPVQHARRRSRR